MDERQARDLASHWITAWNSYEEDVELRSPVAGYGEGQESASGVLSARARGLSRPEIRTARRDVGATRDCDCARIDQTSAQISDSHARSGAGRRDAVRRRDRDYGPFQRAISAGNISGERDGMFRDRAADDAADGTIHAASELEIVSGGGSAGRVHDVFELRVGDVLRVAERRCVDRIALRLIERYGGVSGGVGRGDTRPALNTGSGLC